MRNIWIGLIIVTAAIIIGVAAAWGVVALYKNQAAALTNNALPGIISSECAGDSFQQPFSNRRSSPNQCGRSWSQSEPSFSPRPRNAPGGNWNRPGPMMRQWDQRWSQPQSERINIDKAVSSAEAYLSGFSNSENLAVAEVMEFERNFYIVVVEKDSDRGAFELLVDPFSGAVFPEPGPNMMWNQKYGHMRWQNPEEQNAISFAEAKEIAQKALDDQLPGAEIEGMGIEFYGYYTFDYQQDGQTTGMLSVNATSGKVWFHTWHGDFIAEKEY